MTTARTLALLAAVGAGCALAAPIQAQQRRDLEDRSYIAAKVVLGLGGDVDIAGFETDAELTYGGALAFMHPLHHFFVLGAEFSAHSWQTDVGAAADADRSLLLDLVLVPQLRLPLAGIVEVYGSLPFGLTLDFLNALDGTNVGGVASADVDPALGFAFSALVGARFLLTGSLGLLAELGYSLHSFSHEIDAEAAGVDVGGVDLDVDLQQLTLRAGLYF